MFAPGQRVVVSPDGLDVPERVRSCEPAWTGTINRYWRNGQWFVREDRYGTECAYPARRLAVACEICGEACPEGDPLGGICEVCRDDHAEAGSGGFGSVNQQPRWLTDEVEMDQYELTQDMLDVGGL